MKEEDSTRVRDILTEIRLLCHELDRIVLVPGPPDNAADRASRDRHVGTFVRIVKGSHSGKKGTVIRPRGTEFYYILLEDGREIYKKPKNFTEIPHPST